MKKMKTACILAGALFFLFGLFTLLLTCVDVKPIGPEGTSVGFAGVNQFVFQSIGAHLLWYSITDWLGIVAMLTAFGFASVGFCQLMKRRSIRKVDREILLLGLFYLLLIVCYLFFEQVVINYRPIILGAGPEASYPSSHTMLVVCVMTTAALQFHTFFPNKKKLCLGIDIAAVVIAVITVIGRLVSGVHWLSDIVGGLLLSSALIALYCAGAAYLLCRKEDTPKSEKG